MAFLKGQTTQEAQAFVEGDLEKGTLRGRAGSAEFHVSGAVGNAGANAAANPYELLSGSLAACTALAIETQAQRNGIPISNVGVAVSFYHGYDGTRDTFDRTITFDGQLSQAERDELLKIANYCPVARIVREAADIITHAESKAGDPESKPADYANDLAETLALGEVNRI